MTDYFLGVDVGGTKSLAWLCDERGHLLGTGQAGSAIHQGDDYDITANVLDNITSQALREAGIGRDAVTSACFGMAGFDWESQRQPHMKAITTLGLPGPIELVNDAFLVLHAGASASWGVALIAGTGCNCVGQRKDGRTGRAVGEGFYMGEGAGATELMLQAKYAVAAAWTKSGPPTALTTHFMQALGALNEDDLIEGLATRRYRLSADLAPLVFDVAQTGDSVAQGLITWAAEALASMVQGVCRQLEIRQEAFEIVLGGSFFNAGDALLMPLHELILSDLPGAAFVRVPTPPVIGAILLAMRCARADVSHVCTVKRRLQLLYE